MISEIIIPQVMNNSSAIKWKFCFFLRSENANGKADLSETSWYFEKTKLFITLLVSLWKIYFIKICNYKYERLIIWIFISRK